jgi:hypothetical protein
MEHPAALSANAAARAGGAGAAVAALAAAAVFAGAATAATPIPGIRSPSGNIRCLYVPAARGASTPNLLCRIEQADYAAALQRRCNSSPAGLDWHGFELPAARRGQVVCSGGILYDPARQRPTYTTVAYGTTWRHGPFTCVSRRSGVTCTTPRGHGLFVSRGSWRSW